MITEEDVKHLAKLAKLKLTKEKLEKITPQLDEILEFISILDELDTKNIKATNQTNGLYNISRSDEIKPCDSEKEIIQCSPHKIENNSIIVPKIL